MVFQSVQMLHAADTALVECAAAGAGVAEVFVTAAAAVKAVAAKAVAVRALARLRTEGRRVTMGSRCHSWRLRRIYVV
jgi:hypothetical protein